MDIKLSIVEKISELIESGVTDFMLIPEHGFTLWVAEIIIGLRDIRIQQGLSAARLHIVIPYEEHGSELDDNTHKKLYNVYDKSDAVLTLYRRWHDKCHENCERFIIDKSDLLFTDDETYFAGQYAELHKKPIVVCKTTQHKKSPC